MIVQPFRVAFLRTEKSSSVIRSQQQVVGISMDRHQSELVLELASQYQLLVE
jgi:hypothetical protein